MLLSTISENDADRLALIIHIDTWNDLAKKASGCIGTLPHTAQPSTSAEAQMCKLAGERGGAALFVPAHAYTAILSCLGCKGAIRDNQSPTDCTALNGSVRPPNCT